jgi:hypothetical protein
MYQKSQMLRSSLMYPKSLMLQMNRSYQNFHLPRSSQRFLMNPRLHYFHLFHCFHWYHAFH